MSNTTTLLLDGNPLAFTPGDSIMQAAAGLTITSRTCAITRSLAPMAVAAFAASRSMAD
ncbi:hypothetical protein [Paludibacterium denitrificans]|uniref:hypothetical protein n=1 Tax=Paludibacterium denitrificans TaxID=2675226 RepID=UPI001E416F0D|nr:hypothetical protein [Paludibacterium denitrificans]